MNSDQELPGDLARTEAEANQDLDTADAGNFETNSSVGNAAHRQEINENREQLPGDQYVDEGDDAPRHQEPEFARPAKDVPATSNADARRAQASRMP